MSEHPPNDPKATTPPSAAGAAPEDDAQRASGPAASAAPPATPDARAAGADAGPDSGAAGGVAGARAGAGGTTEGGSPAVPPPPRMAGRLGGFEPTALGVVAVAGVVLVLAVVWLWRSPVPSSQTETRIAAVEAATEGMNRRLDALEGTGARLDRMETALGERLAGLAESAERTQRALAALEQRLEALEQQAQQQPQPVQALPPPDLTPLEQRLTALEESVRGLTERPIADPAALAALRQMAEQLSTRVERAGERQEALTARLQAVEAEAARRDEQLARTITERLAALERTAAERLAVLERTVTERANAAERVATEARQAAEQRAAALAREVDARFSQAEQAISTRLSQLEQAQSQRLATVAGRASRVAAIDALRARLDAGQPLGPALSALGADQAPPEALARFASVPPPTEAALRLSFEEHARAARAASEAQPAAGSNASVLDSALARLSGLVTVRRGERVVWGDAAAAELERSRRALEAGDLEGALAPIGKLPPAAQEAMRPWTDQARALLGARAALRQLTTAASASGG